MPLKPSSKQIALVAGVVAGVAAVVVLTVAARGVEPRPDLFFGLWRARHLALAGALATMAVLALLAGRSRRALFGGLYVLVLVGVTVSLFELAAVAGVVSYAELMGNHRSIPSNVLGAERRPGIDVRGETYQDIATDWGLEHEPIPFHYRTDAFGFRNDPDAADPGVFLIGDSILVGGLVAYEQTLAGRLASRLGTPVMNVALIGISVQEAIELFEELDLPVAGREVLQLFFEGNDLLDSRDWRARREASEQPATSRLALWVDRSFLQNLVLWLQRATAPATTTADRLACRIDGVQYGYVWKSQSFAGLDAEVPHVFAALESFAARVTAAGGRYRVVFVPSKLRVLAPSCEAESWVGGDPSSHVGPMRTAFRRWSATSGIPVIDLTEALERSARGGDIPWFWGDTHWNARGHAVAAETLAAALGSSQPGSGAAGRTTVEANAGSR